MIARLTPTVLLIAAVAFGCNSTSPPSAQPVLTGTPSVSPSGAPETSDQPVVTIARMPACGLVLAAEVIAAVGIPIEEAEEVPGATDPSSWLSDCIYWRQESREQAPLKVTLAAGPAYLDVFAALRGADGVTAAEGLGDESFVRMVTVPGLDQPLGSLYVRLGNSLLVLAFGIVGVGADGGLQLAGDSAAQSAMLTDLAGFAIARLIGQPVASPRETPGGAPLPVNEAALAHPCGLVSDAEVGAIVGVQIENHEELSARADKTGATCDYRMELIGNPLTVRLGQGETAVQNFNADIRGIEGWAPVPGLGDEAFTQPDPYYGDESFVVVAIRKGNVVLELHIGPIGEDDSGSEVPPGTPEQQMEMIRKLAELLLPRIIGG